MADGICDIDETRPATHTVRVRQNGRETILELCDTHYQQLRRQQSQTSPFESLFSGSGFNDFFGDDWEYWLVFPEDADLTKNKISILSPIGCALLGYGIGDKITLDTPSGKNDLTVREVIHQPEREGNFDL